MSTSSATGTSGNAYNYTGPTRLTGLVSGFDTKSMVEQLMALERQPLEKLDIKKQSEQLKLTAYQALNTSLLKFRSSVSTLSSSKLWNSKKATSTNEKSLTATASEYAVSGSYSFKTAQLATITQYMSKGFASSKDPLLKQEKVGDEDPKPVKLGEINLSSAKTRVDNSAKLEQLNGGKGVFRGSVRITDGKGTTSTVDLSGCDTVDDVVRALNESSGAQINAKIEDGVINITDASGVEGGTIKVQNVGTGTTATDLGIAGTAKGTVGTPAVPPDPLVPGDTGTPEVLGKPASLKGRNVYTMGRDTSLELLNDGLGIEEGMFRMQVTDSEGYYLQLDINVNDCKTLGDVMDRANAEIERIRDLNEPFKGGLMHSSKLEGLHFGVSADGTSLALTGTKKEYAYVFGDLIDENKATNTYPAQGLGLNGTKTAEYDDQELVFDRIFGGVNSPMLKNLNGTAGVGVGASENDDRILLPTDLTDDTPLKALNGGNGYTTNMPILQIVTHEGGRTVTDLDDTKKTYHHSIVTAADITEFFATFDPAHPNYPGRDEPTVGDFKKFVNDKIQEYAENPDNNAAALKGLYFDLDSDGVKRFSVYGAQGGYSYEIGGTIASTLGVSRGSTTEGKGTMVEKYLDEESPEYEAYEKEIKDFYNVGKPSLLGTNEAFDEDSTLADILGGMHGLKREDYGSEDDFEAAVDAWKASVEADPNGTLATLFGSDKLKITTGVGSDIFTAEIDIPTIVAGMTADTTAQEFIDTINQAIKDAFAVPDPVTGAIFDTSAPQLTFNATKDNLQWSNIDFSRAWEFDGGDAFDRLHMNKNTGTPNEAGELTFATQGEHALTGDLSVGLRGYIQYTDLTADNADTVTLGELNYGLGLGFGAADDTLDITLDGHSISITYQEIADLMASKVPAGTELGDVSVATYVESLNELVQDKLSTINAGISNASDHLSFEFKVGSDRLEVADFKNIKKFGMAGELASEERTGINSGEMDVEKDKSYVVGSMIAGIHVPQDIDGLGEIEIQLGSGDAVRLNTTGLTQDSTLSELLAKLNSQLEDLVATDPEWAEVRFTLNEAGTGIAVENNSSKRVTFHDTKQPLVDKDGNPVLDSNNEPVGYYSDGQYLAQDLGLVNDDGSSIRVDPYTFHNSKSLNRSMISRATKLDEYYSSTKDKGAITISNSLGESISFSLGDAKTIGDVIDAINDYGQVFQDSGVFVQARINAKGDGIEFYELHKKGTPDYGEDGPGNITISDVDGGSFAKSLGMAGSGKGEVDEKGNLKYTSSINATIEVMSNDTLESIMYRISASGNYKCAVVNDGSKNNPYRLSISSASTGEANDFVIQSDTDLFGFTQTSRAKDAKVLYGDPNSTASPVMLSSSTNTNSTAILGLTLNLNQASSEWTTITVDSDKEKVKESISAMVEGYNEMAELVAYLDAYDPETGEPGIFFGDSAVRTLMDDINDFFYAVYNPNNARIGSVGEDGKQTTWSWMDLGVSLTAKQSNSDGTGGWYSTMELDLDALDTMVAENWDVLSSMLAQQRNVADSNLSENVRPSASFSGELEDGFDVNNAINGNASSGSFGPANGIQSKGTIKDGNNEYTIFFQQPTTMTRMSIYHQSSDTALKNFTVEYLDANTGKWEVLREIEDNKTDANHLGMALPTKVQAIRIRADSTNAEDDKFRLLDVQVWEESGLASKLNHHTTTLGDSQIGFLAERNTEVQATLTDIKEQMERLQDRLTQKEEALWRKFTAMETALGKMNNQSDYFSQMMGTGTSKK